MLMVQAVIGNVCMRLMMSKQLKDQYRFAMEFMLQDTADADNVGIGPVCDPIGG